MLKWHDEQLNLLLNANSEQDLFNILSIISRELGFDFCSYDITLSWPVTKQKIMRFNNYPPSWQQWYFQSKYEKIDPTVLHGKRSVLPIIWEDTDVETTRAFWKNARIHGLQTGWAQSCHGNKGISSLLNLGSSDNRITRRDLYAITSKLSWLVRAGHEVISTLLTENTRIKTYEELTARELDVLRWSVDGKTADETAKIMHITPRTVSFHLANILRKLNATNKTGASIKAVMLGIL